MSDDKQSRFGRRHDHLLLKPDVLPKPPKVKRIRKEGEKPHFPVSSKTAFGTLSQQLSKVMETAEQHVIFKSPVLYFFLELSDSISWKSIGLSIEKLGLTIVSYIDDKHLRVSVNKGTYDNFLTNLEKNHRYIQGIKEITVFDKLDKGLIEEVKNNPDSQNLVSLEFSSINGLQNIDNIESVVNDWAIKQDYQKFGTSYKTHNTLVLTGFITNKGVQILAEQLDAVSIIVKVPELALDTSEKDRALIDDDISLELNSLIPLDKSSINTYSNHPIITIDSGINRSHQLLNQNIFDTFDYSTGAQLPCSDYLGHGSAVAGLTIYGDDLRRHPIPTAKAIAIKNFERGLNARGQIIAIPIEVDTIKVINDAISRYRFTSRIINLSFSARGPNPTLTKVLDEIIFKEDFIILASAGNIKNEHIESYLDSGLQYPDYVEQQIVFFPGDCRHVVTVGAHTENQSSFVSKNCPSPFTRSCCSNLYIKPEVMALGGNLERSQQYGVNKVFSSNGLGVVTTSNQANGQIEEFGTSFSSPIVANTVASIVQKRFGLSCFLIKALLISASRQMPDINRGCNFSTAIQGFGRIERDYAINTLDWRVCYLLQGEFDSNNPEVFHRYRFLFPDAADQINISVVFGKERYEQSTENDEYLRLRYKRPGPKLSTPLKRGFRVGSNKGCCFKDEVHIQRGSRGSWNIDIAAHFSRLQIHQKFKYGIVITVLSTKKESIYDSVMSWVKPQVDTLLVPNVAVKT